MVIPVKNKPINYLRTNISTFLKKAAGSNRSELQDWISDESIIKKFHINIKKEQSIYTLHDPNNDKMLCSFFYPPKVVNRVDTKTPLDEIVKCNESNGVLISGNLGQGKSILLRYLQFIELNMGDSIPIFIELRKVKDPNYIIDTACAKINELGLTCSNKLFSFLLGEGKISIFMDGFDETPLEERDKLNEKLSKICLKYNKSKFIVTSRKNTEVSKNPHFQTFTISRLVKNDHAPFIKKLLPHENEHLPILTKISESNEFDYDVLDTPLLLTWFILVYQKRNKIPKTKLGFYEDLFGTILSRHDGGKDSFNRQSHSKLSDDEVKEVFCTLSYLTRKDQQSIFTKTEILKQIRKALNTCKHESIKTEDYLYDLTHVTCLLKPDGLDYQFIHESVTQYFSACFIENSGDENSKIFYTGRIDDWKKWEGEISFLKYIDTLRYNEYLLLPSINKVVNDVDGIKTVDVSFVKNMIVSSWLAGRIVNEKYEFITFLSSYSVNYSLYVSLDYELLSELSQHAGAFLQLKIFEDNKNKKIIDESIDDFGKLNLSDFTYLKTNLVLKKLSLVNQFLLYISPYIENILLTQMKDAEGVLERESSRKGLYE